MNIPQSISWKSRIHSVNDSIYDFGWVFQETPVKNCMTGMLWHALLLKKINNPDNVQNQRLITATAGLKLCYGRDWCYAPKLTSKFQYFPNRITWLPHNIQISQYITIYWLAPLTISHKFTRENNKYSLKWLHLFKNMWVVTWKRRYECIFSLHTMNQTW